MPGPGHQPRGDRRPASRAAGLRGRGCLPQARRPRHTGRAGRPDGAGTGRVLPRRLDDSIAHGGLAASIAADTNQAWLTAWCLASMINPLAARDPAEAARHLERTERVRRDRVGGRGAELLQLARSRIAHATTRPRHRRGGPGVVHDAPRPRPDRTGGPAVAPPVRGGARPSRTPGRGAPGPFRLRRRPQLATGARRCCRRPGHAPRLNGPGAALTPRSAPTPAASNWRAGCRCPSTKFVAGRTWP